MSNTSTGQAPLRDRLRYAFDNTMDKGSVALIGWLVLLTMAVIVIAAAIVVLFGIAPEGGDKIGFIEAAWLSLMRTFDAGTMGGDMGWSFRFVSLWVTLGGIFILSTLIGLLTNGISNKLDELRKGRSRVIESNHTVILGWSEQIFAIISELVLANVNQHRSVIVVLGDRDKIEMEDEIRAKAPSALNTRIVCRSGTPLEMADLDIVSPDAARSIIVLAPDDGDPDSYVIKTLLAILNRPSRRNEPYHIVAEMRQAKNVAVAKMVGGNEVELVLTGDLIARIMAQTCRQSGLSTVYTELMDFGGDEIYMHIEPGLVGKTFAEALFAYEDSTVIGLQTADGLTQLKPDLATPIQPGDRIIAISKDDDTIRLSTPQNWAIQDAAIQPIRPIEQRAERTLMLGWNRRASTVIRELDHYVGAGSNITVVLESAEENPDIATCRALLQQQTLDVIADDATNRDVLDSLNVETYDHVLVLSDDDLPTQQADARTLVTLLHLRAIAENVGRDFAIVTEMLDIRNRNLAEVTRADDFIVSDRLVSLMLAQVSENKALNAVFADIFDPEGAEIYLKPAGLYVRPGEAVNFYTVLEAARRRHEVAIGYRQQAYAHDKAHSYGVTINPSKSQTLRFAEGDRIIVLAE